MGNSKTAHAIASFLALALLTYVSIVFGELYPKRIALNLKDDLAVRAAPLSSFGQARQSLCLAFVGLN